MIPFVAFGVVVGWLAHMLAEAYERNLRDRDREFARRHPVVSGMPERREDERLQQAAREIARRQNRELSEWGPF